MMCGVMPVPDGGEVSGKVGIPVGRNLLTQSTAVVNSDPAILRRS